MRAPEKDIVSVRTHLQKRVAARVQRRPGKRSRNGATIYPPGTTTMEDAKDPISAKKLHKGDGRWDTTKEILGYMLDGIACTRSVWH
jgi:hypothetical protein